MRPARVLIVDNDRRLRTQLYTRLLDHDIFSDAVSNANDALEYLRDRGYGLILLDLELPNDEAYALIDQIRRTSSAQRPMVLATASRESKPSVDADIVQIIMRKPLRLADLSEMIRSCLGGASKTVSGVAESGGRGVDVAFGNEHEIRVVS